MTAFVLRKSCRMLQARRRLNGALLCLAALTFCLAARGQSTVNLAWDPVTLNALAGYRVYYGGGSGNYTNMIGAGMATNASVSGLTPGATYYFAVTDYDTSGMESVYSTEISYTPAASASNTPPAIALTSPATGASYTAPASIGLAASVSANGHTVTQIQFRNGSTVLAQDTTAPYAFTWSGVPAGTYTLSAVAVYDTGSTVASAPVTVTVAPAAATNPATGLVAAYGFEEGAGSTVADRSGNGNNGVLSGATWTAAGRFGNALAFNGANALVTINDSATLRLSSAMTLEAWVKPSAVNSAWRDVLYKGDDNYYLEGTSDNGSLPALGGTFSGSPLYGTGALPANTWTHLAATYDGATLRLYTNGVQVASRAQTGIIAASANPLQIGGDSIYGQFFQGAIDEVRVYNVALTAAQLQQDMLAPVAPPAGPQPPPAPWQTRDIGAVGLAGNATVTASAFTVAGAGMVSGSADSFRFLYQPLSGDGEVRAQLSAVQNTGANGDVGVMIREALTSGSRYAFMGLSPSGAYNWQRRTSTGGNTSSTTSGTGTPPNAWARLVRTGNTLYGYQSANGSNWTLVKSANVTMATNIYLGLAVASGSTNTLNTSTFTNLMVVP